MLLKVARTGICDLDPLHREKLHHGRKCGCCRDLTREPRQERNPKTGVELACRRDRSPNLSVLTADRETAGLCWSPTLPAFFSRVLQNASPKRGVTAVRLPKRARRELILCRRLGPLRGVGAALYGIEDSATPSFNWLDSLRDFIQNGRRARSAITQAPLSERERNLELRRTYKIQIRSPAAHSRADDPRLIVLDGGSPSRQPSSRRISQILASHQLSQGNPRRPTESSTLMGHFD